jgi:hypothetical protein
MNQALRLDQPAYAKDYGARALGLDGFSQAAGTGVVVIGEEEHFAAASAPGKSAIAFRTGERKGAATNGSLLCIDLPGWASPACR